MKKTPGCPWHIMAFVLIMIKCAISELAGWSALGRPGQRDLMPQGIPLGCGRTGVRPPRWRVFTSECGCVHARAHAHLEMTTRSLRTASCLRQHFVPETGAHAWHIVGAQYVYVKQTESHGSWGFTPHQHARNVFSYDEAILMAQPPCVLSNKLKGTLSSVIGRIFQGLRQWVAVVIFLRFVHVPP